MLFRSVVNVKGLQDPYRNPTTQKGWAERWGQNAAMVTSFADGSKISFEQTIVANATGFKVLERGMSRGMKFDGSPLEDAIGPIAWTPLADGVRQTIDRLRAAQG